MGTVLRAVSPTVDDLLVRARSGLHRLDPVSAFRAVAWIICCDEGYSSSLAAASLQALGLHQATDLAGGFRAWRAAGLPVATPGRPSRPRLPRPA